MNKHLKRQKMKEKIVNHFANVVIHHRKIIISITVILCILSIIAMILFLKVDVTLPAMAGKHNQIVKDVMKLRSNFNISNLVNVAVQPLPDKEKHIREYHKEIDDILLKNVNQDYKNEVLNIINDYCEKKRSKLLSTKDFTYTAIEILKILDHDKRENIINGIDNISEKTNKRILEGLERNEETKLLYRKISSIEHSEILKILGMVDQLDKNQQEVIVKTILEKLKVPEKKNILKNIKTIDENLKTNILSDIDDIYNKINKELLIFRNSAVLFADELKKELLKNKKLKTDPSFTYKDFIEGVVYSDEFSLTDDKMIYIIRVIPKVKMENTGEIKLFMDVVDGELNNLKEVHQDLLIRRTGNPAYTVDEEEVLLDGFAFMMIITIIGILLISFIGLKKIVYPLISFIPLSIGILLMFGIYAVTIQELNPMTIITPIILFGIGIDYALHFGANYGEVRAELGKDASQEEVLRKTFDNIGLGLTIGSLTTLLAFLSLTASSIGGFAQLSVIAASGVFTSFIAMVYILPIIVTWREKHNKKVEANFLKSHRYIWLGRFCISRIGIIISIIIMAFAFTFFILLPGLNISIDKNSMFPQHSEANIVAKLLTERSDVSDNQSYYLLDSYEELVKFNRALNKREDGVMVYKTINTNGIVDSRRAIRVFKKEGWDGKFETIEKYKKKYAESSGLIGNSNERAADLYEFLLKYYIDWENDKYLVMVPPSGYLLYEDYMELHVNDIKKIEEATGENAIGIVKVFWFFYSNMSSDLLKSSAIALITIIIILIITTKSLRGTIICTLTLLISILATLTYVVLVDFKLNFINVLAFPITIGLGIDYSVHIYYRIMMNKLHHMVEMVSSTGKAVLLTTLTTLMAFGTISFSAHPGVAQLGQITFVGITFAFVSSMFVIPNLTRLMFRKELKRAITDDEKD